MYSSLPQGMATWHFHPNNCPCALLPSLISMCPNYLNLLFSVLHSGLLVNILSPPHYTSHLSLWSWPYTLTHPPNFLSKSILWNSNTRTKGSEGWLGQDSLATSYLLQTILSMWSRQWHIKERADWGLQLWPIAKINAKQMWQNNNERWTKNINSSMCDK